MISRNGDMPNSSHGRNHDPGYSIIRPEPQTLARSQRWRPIGEPYVLITGGAGFIGTNLADAMLEQGHRVVLLDNLSRLGVAGNYQWLRRRHGQQVTLHKADVRDEAAVRHAVAGAKRVYHFAAQVAVTQSLVDPVMDFEVNARGTLNVLEAIRACDTPPPLLFTSTNKVYGERDQLRLRPAGRRYEPADDHNAPEPRPGRDSLHFCSPYGCSKGAADQYVLDYAATFNMPAMVFRMSCIYGPHQRGTEDQGWVAHFLINTLRERAITLYGDGKQVRDLLHVSDLIRAMHDAMTHLEKPDADGNGKAITRPRRVYDIGGGPDNAFSLVELIDLIEALHGSRPLVRFDRWRTADQRYYVSDTRAFEQATGWRPRIAVRQGIADLYDWFAGRQRRADMKAAQSRGDACPG